MKNIWEIDNTKLLSSKNGNWPKVFFHLRQTWFGSRPLKHNFGFYAAVILSTLLYFVCILPLYIVFYAKLSNFCFIFFKHHYLLILFTTLPSDLNILPQTWFHLIPPSLTFLFQHYDWTTHSCLIYHNSVFGIDNLKDLISMFYHKLSKYEYLN